MIAVYRALGGGWQIRCSGFQPQVLLTDDLAADAPVELIPAPAGEQSDSNKQDLNQLPTPSEGLSEDNDDD
jgi:hypothetical protein